MGSCGTYLKGAQVACRVYGVLVLLNNSLVFVATCLKFDRSTLLCNTITINIFVFGFLQRSTFFQTKVCEQKFPFLVSDSCDQIATRDAWYHEASDASSTPVEGDLHRPFASRTKVSSYDQSGKSRLNQGASPAGGGTNYIRPNRRHALSSLGLSLFFDVDDLHLG